MYHVTGEYAKNNFSEVLEKASTETWRSCYCSGK